MLLEASLVQNLGGAMRDLRELVDSPGTQAGERVRSPRLSSRSIRDWKDIHRGELAAILGTGPSLERHDVSTFPGLLFGVNGSWKKTTAVDYWCAQDLDDLKAMDRGEWELDIGTDVFVLGRPENIEVLEDDPRVVLVPIRTERVGHRLSPRRVFSFDLSDEGVQEHNSGLFALQIAVWIGCDPIWLLGFDCRGGHFYDDVPSITPHDAIARKLDQAAKAFRRGRVLNANPDSAVRGFEFRDFEATFGRRSA